MFWNFKIINFSENRALFYQNLVLLCQLWICPESDLRDVWAESNDVLDSDGESPDTGARLLKFSKFSFLTELGHFFINF